MLSEAKSNLHPGSAYELCVFEGPSSSKGEGSPAAPGVARHCQADTNNSSFYKQTNVVLYWWYVPGTLLLQVALLLPKLLPDMTPWYACNGCAAASDQQLCISSSTLWHGGLKGIAPLRSVGGKCWPKVQTRKLPLEPPLKKLDPEFRSPKT